MHKQNVMYFMQRVVGRVSVYKDNNFLNSIDLYRKANSFSFNWKNFQEVTSNKYFPNAIIYRMTKIRDYYELRNFKINLSFHPFNFSNFAMI
jgi:hypothetical protein